MDATEPRVLFRDDGLLAVDKPSGLLVHRGWGKDDVVLVDLVRDLLGTGRVHPAHRLDRGTSGVVLLALDPDRARRLRALFDEGRVCKRYLALVRGEAPEHVVVDHPIPRRRDGPRVPSVTEIERLATVETEPREMSVVEARPRTGRLHQVRRHLKHLSHPVIGDANYGKGSLNRAVRERYGLARLGLHALEVSLPWPEEEQLTIRAELPSDLAEPLLRMGFDERVFRKPR